MPRCRDSTIYCIRTGPSPQYFPTRLVCFTTGSLFCHFLAKLTPSLFPSLNFNFSRRSTMWSTRWRAKLAGQYWTRRVSYSALLPAINHLNKVLYKSVSSWNHTWVAPQNRASPAETTNITSRKLKVAIWTILPALHNDAKSHQLIVHA